MSLIHRFIGNWGEDFIWDGARTRIYSQGASGARETWLIGKAEKAKNFAIRYYELEPGGYSREEYHPYDHGVLFIRGSGQIRLDRSDHPVTQGDIVYIAPNEVHQIKNTGDEALGWICVIPALRQKKGNLVWAEEGIKDLENT
jgi:ribulose-bisphosphate carboxylase large chain